MRSQQLPNERRHAAARVPRVPSRNVWLVLAATCLAMPHQAAAAGGGASAVETLSRQSFASAAVLVTVFLILFSIGFEKAEHFMLHRPSKVTRPVVRSMFQELTGLGFLGVVLFVVESTPLVTSLSKELFGSTHGSDLASVIHQVHMALFLVLCIFLANVLLLMVMAMRAQKTWAARELACVDRKKLVNGYSSFISRPKRQNACVRFYRWVCSQQDEVYERVVYSAMRARFLRPNSLSGSSAPVVHQHEIHDDGSMIVNLNHTNAKAYRKKLVVYAFQSRDPCRFDKHWGQSKGESGDYVIVGVDGDLYSCSRALFEDTYEPINGEPNKYRKTGHNFARHMTHEFKVKTESGLQRGSPGSYLVQDAKTGQQYSVTAVEFERLYEPVDSAVLHRDAKDLPKDFDFGAYLTHQLGTTLGEIVSLEWHTWCFILCMVGLLYVTLLFEHTAPFFVMNHGLGIAWALTTLLFMRKMYNIRDMLTPRRLVAGFKASARRIVPTPITSNVQAAHAAKAPAKIIVDEPTQSVGDAESKGDAVVPLAGHDSVQSQQLQASGRGGGASKAGLPGPAASTFTAYGGPGTTRQDLLIGHGDENSPSYMDLEQPTKGGCCSRRPPNRQESLFWFGHVGVEFVKEFIRANILFMSMFLAVNCMILERLDCTMDNGCPARIVLIFVPQILNVILLPRLITAYVVVANVELLRKNKVVQEVNRRQRTEKAMRALRLLSALRSYGRKLDRKDLAAGDAEAPTPAHSSRRRTDFRGAAVRVYGSPGTATYIRKRHEFQEAFAIFDRESTGHVRVENVQSLFELMGLGDKAEEAARSIVHELDVDGGDTIEFEEFFDWTAAQHEAVDAESVTRDIFNIIDRDHSHDITATELRDTLASLGAVMSAEDIMRTVADADHDGSGSINFHEFAALMNKYMKDT